MWPDREQSGNYKTHSCLLRLGLGLAKLDQTLLMSNIFVPPPRVMIKVSLPNGLSEFWESEPIGICKNNNSIHDQGRGYRYLHDKRSK